MIDFEVSDMSCGHCAATITRAVQAVDPKAEVDVLSTGLAASPGAASGRVAFDPETAVRMNEAGEDVILVRSETSPDDIHGLVAALGIVTAHGGSIACTSEPGTGSAFTITLPVISSPVGDGEPLTSAERS